MSTRMECSIPCIIIIHNLFNYPKWYFEWDTFSRRRRFSTTGMAKRSLRSSELRLQFSISLTSENKNKKRKDLIAESKDIHSSTHLLVNGARNSLMSTPASI